MRFLFSLILIATLVHGCGPSPAPAPQQRVEQAPAQEFVENGCVVKTQSNLVNERRVSAIYNLVKDKEELGAMGRCTVDFDIKVDGVAYHLHEVEEGLEQLESLCYYARERARKNLLLDLGGDFKTEATVACKQVDRNH